MRVVEGLREGLRLAQQYQGTAPVAALGEPWVQSEPEIDGLLTRVTLLRQVLEVAELQERPTAILVTSGSAPPSRRFGALCLLAMTTPCQVPTV